MRKYRYWPILAAMALIMGLRGKYIALWREGDPEPVRVFPYQISSLPPEDQKRLREGIVIENESRLIQLMEDYFS